jgi:hypothetical protein
LSDQTEKDVADFLSRVVPWPANNRGSGCINVHWHLPGKPFRGRCVREVGDMVNTATEICTTTNHNVYYCLSLQAEPGGKRNKDNALKLKSIWLDIDVKDKEDTYKSLQEADSAVAEFVKRHGLPTPNAVVRSGGGLHVYWISDQPLGVDEWRAYASGLRSLALESRLKCDAGVTTDPARVLRIPGTKNFKTDPPKPVELIRLMDKDYDFATDLAVLKNHATDTHVRHRIVKSTSGWRRRFVGFSTRTKAFQTVASTLSR